MEDIKRIVLAFDIERSGATDQNTTIGIGASVVDDQFNELDSLFLPGYLPKQVIFEKRCWDEFWSKHPEQLELLECKDEEISLYELQHEMITAFQAFRIQWEIYAKENNIEYVIASDNCVYDGGFINEMIFKCLPGDSPLPYSASTQEYSDFIDTHNCQRGLLMIIDPSYKDWWGFSDRIEELFQTPPKRKEHDHNPANDAYTIAFDQQVLFAIRDGMIKRKS